MKHLKLLVATCLFGGLMASCTVTTVSVNSNPVGDSKGVAKATNFQSDADYTLARAAKKGGIEKIGVVEIKSTSILIYQKIETTVSGN